jgi:hypothetical protein
MRNSELQARGGTLVVGGGFGGAYVGAAHRQSHGSSPISRPVIGRV